MSITPRKIETMIYVIRGQKVMLDSDLAELYGVETKNLNKAVKRNTDKFPDDFRFQLSYQEVRNLRFQNGTFNEATKNRKYLPYVFTEYGIVALSGVLNSEIATRVNISIVRTFIKMRRILAEDEILSEKIHKIEKNSDHMFKIIFERLDDLEESLPVHPKTRKKIGIKGGR